LIDQAVMQLDRDCIVYGYNQWKPVLRESLKNIFTHVQFNRLSKDLKFDWDVRPTGLTLEQWLGLFHYFLHEVSKDKQSLVMGAEQGLKSQQRKLHKTHRTSVRRDTAKKSENSNPLMLLLKTLISRLCMQCQE